MIKRRKVHHEPELSGRICDSKQEITTDRGHGGFSKPIDEQRKIAGILAIFRVHARPALGMDEDEEVFRVLPPHGQDHVIEILGIPRSV